MKLRFVTLVAEENTVVKQKTLQVFNDVEEEWEDVPSITIRTGATR